MSRWLRWLPLTIFALFFVSVAAGLIIPKNDVIASKMIGKKIPDFNLPAAIDDRPTVTSDDLKSGKPVLLNIFASWCVPCIAEAPQLLALKEAGAEINGIAIRDTSKDINNFVTRWGNPYTRIGSDVVSKVQLDIGSSGVPETFIVDGKGVIVHQHVGDIRPEDVPGILKMLEEAK